jgi:hypothetical protein
LPADGWSRFEESCEDCFDAGEGLEHDYRNGGMIYVPVADWDEEGESYAKSLSLSS